MNTETKQIYKVSADNQLFQQYKTEEVTHMVWSQTCLLIQL